MSRQAFIAILGPLERLIDINHISQTLLAIPNLVTKGQAYASGLAAKSIKIEFAEGDLIAVKGEVCDRFILIQGGTCYTVDDHQHTYQESQDPNGIVTSGKDHNHHTGLLGVGDCVGSQMFLHEHTGEFDRTIVAQSACTCLEISWEDFHHFDSEFGHQATDDELLDQSALMQNADGSMNALLSNLAGGSKRARQIEADSHEFAVKERRETSASKIATGGQNAEQVSRSLKPNDILTALRDSETFHFPQGRYSQVSHVRVGGTSLLVKRFSILKVHGCKVATCVVRERDFLGIRGNHPFLQNLTQACKTKTDLFLLFDGASVSRMHMQQRVQHLVARGEAMATEHALFYIASILSVMEHIHSFGYIHRAICSENILIDCFGYICLTEFGHIRRLRASLRTFTMCGVLEYIAPEVILGLGYGYAADSWSAGILAYEILTGRTPFSLEASTSTMELFHSILNKDIVIHRELRNGVDYNLQDLILALLTPDPTGRIGSGKHHRGTDHIVFVDFQWEKLLSRRLEAPWIPSIDEKNSQTKSHVLMEFEDGKLANGSTIFEDWN